MRRGGILILLIGLIFIIGAGALFFFLTAGGTSLGGVQEGPTPLPTEDPGVEVVIARIDIPANTVITDTDTLLDTERIATASYNERRQFLNVNDVRGQLTTRSIAAGEQIVSAALTEPGLAQIMPTQEPDRPRDKAYPLQVDSLSGVADQLKPGDTVDVVATFNVIRRRSYPISQRLEDQAGQTVPVLERELTDLDFATTKTLVQRVQVLQVIRPPVAAEGTPGAAPPPPAAEPTPAVTEDGQPIPQTAPAAAGATTITQGEWILVLAVNNQELELLEFARATEAQIALVLRGAGDTEFEQTIGVTFDLLVSEFGVPLPRPLPPRVLSPEEVFDPEPTQTPAPTRVP